MDTVNQRCTLTELYVSDCAHCRDLAAGRRRPASVPSGTDDLRGEFQARWPGTCAHCGERYHQDEWIGVTHTGDYICGKCVL